MTNSPKVIFNYEFVLAINSPDRVKKDIDQTLKRTVNMFDYYANIKKRAMGLFDYYTGNINKDDTMNLVLEDGHYATLKEKEKRKKDYLKYIEKSNLSKCVISFNNDYLNENININRLEKILVKEVIPMFLKKCGYVDLKKMSYQLSLHTDTDNLHFHFSYIEKEPNYLYGNKKIGYKRKGELSEVEINFLKNEIEHVIEREKLYTPLLIQTNKEIDDLKSYFKPNEKNFLLKDKEDLLLEEKILRLGKLLFELRNGSENKIKFNSIKDKEIKQLTKDIKNYVFTKDNGEFKNEYSKFKESIKSLNNYFYELSVSNNIKNIKQDTSFTDGKVKYLDNYIYNAIVNYANNFYKYKKKKVFTENDIIKEIVYRDYIRNKKQSRYNILKNYLSNNNPKSRFNNKYLVRQAIKNINNEMEEASKEFSKLFENNCLSKM